MTIWQGIGINYGHQAIYDTTQVESDFAYLRSQGVTRLRIAMPNYDNTHGKIANGQDMVQRALNHGFSVIWGVEAGYGMGTITATRWAAYKNYVVNTLASWAQSAKLSELCLDNESDIQVDGTTLLAATVRADIRAMASTIKANGFTGKVSCSTSAVQQYRTPWITEGIGSLDLIGWNSYDIYANFDTRNGIVQAAFGNKTYISEFGSNGGGYPDFNDETAFYNDTASRITSMKNAGIGSGYFFCYRDGDYGMSPDTFALVLSTGAVRKARQAVLGTMMAAMYILRSFGSVLMITTPPPITYVCRAFGSTIMINTTPPMGVTYVIRAFGSVLRL